MSLRGGSTENPLSYAAAMAWFAGGLSYAEAAERFGVTRAAVSGQVRRFRERRRRRVVEAAMRRGQPYRPGVDPRPAWLLRAPALCVSRSGERGGDMRSASGRNAT